MKPPKKEYLLLKIWNQVFFAKDRYFLCRNRRHPGNRIGDDRYRVAQTVPANRLVFRLRLGVQALGVIQH